HVEVLDRPHPARAAHAALNLVRDQEDAVARAELPERLEPAVRWNDVAALAENRLHDDRGDLRRLDEAFEQHLFEVVDRRKGTAVLPEVEMAEVAPVPVRSMENAGEHRSEVRTVERLARRDGDAPVR